MEVGHLDPGQAPEGYGYEVVPEDHPHMVAAKRFSEQATACKNQVGVAIVKNDIVLGGGAITADGGWQGLFCGRVAAGSKSGQGYEFCPGCDGKHGEPQAIADAHANNHTDLTGAVAYMWGHYWCCSNCWQAMLDAGVTKVYVIPEAEARFSRPPLRQAPERARAVPFAVLTSGKVPEGRLEAVKRGLEGAGITVDNEHQNPNGVIIVLSDNGARVAKATKPELNIDADATDHFYKTLSAELFTWLA